MLRKASALFDRLRYWLGITCFIIVGIEFFMTAFVFPMTFVAAATMCEKEASLCPLESWMPAIIVAGGISKCIFLFMAGMSLTKDGMNQREGRVHRISDERSQELSIRKANEETEHEEAS